MTRSGKSTPQAIVRSANAFPKAVFSRWFAAAHTRAAASAVAAPVAGARGEPALAGRKDIREAWTPPNTLMEAFGIENEWLKRFPSALSGGEQRCA